MDNSQTNLRGLAEAPPLKYNTVNSDRLNFHEIKVSADSRPNLWSKFAHFSQQLSTFPTCTESAAILVFAFESNPTGREEGRWNSKNKPCFKFPSPATKTRGLFGPDHRSSRAHGASHVVLALHLRGHTVLAGLLEGGLALINKKAGAQICPSAGWRKRRWLQWKSPPRGAAVVALLLLLGCSQPGQHTHTHYTHITHTTHTRSHYTHSHTCVTPDFI